jgi:Domain of unknown function (DUF4345)
MQTTDQTTKPTLDPATHDHPTASHVRVLRLVLAVLGAVSAFVAINVAFGGLETLGWQGATDYFQVTDADAFELRDSHARFYGGVYVGIAALLIVASTNVRRYRQALLSVFAFIFVGGLARLTQGQLDVTLGRDLAVSSVIELVGMPALAFWLFVATRPAPIRRQRELATSL